MNYTLSDCDILNIYLNLNKYYLFGAILINYPQGKTLYTAKKTSTSMTKLTDTPSPEPPKNVRTSTIISKELSYFNIQDNNRYNIYI